MAVKAPIFVVGVPRSGTTLLQSLLSAHPNTYSLPETHFFSTILPRLGISADDQIDEETLGKALDLLDHLMELHLSHGQRHELHELTMQTRLTGKGLLNYVFSSYEPVGHGDLRVIEKTPLHAEHLTEIHSSYADAKFIHIVRDPRNTISSLLQTDFVPTHWVLWHTQYWNYILALTERFSRQCPTAIFTVKYETLVQQSVETLHAICDFLYLEYDDRMLTDFSFQLRRNVLAGREPWKTRNQDMQIHHDPTAWNDRLTMAEGWLIEMLTGNNMARFGYQRVANPVWKDRVAIILQSLRQPHQDRQADRMGRYLIGRCLQQDLGRNARLLASCVVLNDWTQLRDPNIRRSLIDGAL